MAKRKFIGVYYLPISEQVTVSVITNYTQEQVEERVGADVIAVDYRHLDRRTERVKPLKNVVKERDPFYVS